MTLIDQLLAHPDIAKLPDSKGEAIAWCPWHNDRAGGHASLGINVRKKVAKCWSCGKGGPLEFLAKAWGIPVEEDGPTGSQAAKQMTAEEAMDRLMAIYGLRKSTVAHFQITADVAAKRKGQVGAWCYPTAGGPRWKAWNRQGKPKYWHKQGYPSARVLYGIEDVTQDADLVILVNGEPSVWVCRQAGIDAVAAIGENTFGQGHVEQLVARGVRHVRVVLDLDHAGAEATRRTLAILRDGGLTASAGQLPEHLGHKSDVADLYKWNDFQDDPFRAELLALAERVVPSDNPLAGSGFSIRGGRFVQVSSDRYGEETEIRLTNFTCWATEEVTVDDGISEDKHIVMEGKMEDGRGLPQVRVEAGKVLKLDWIPEKWGISPIINAGRNTKELAREILQRLSVGRGLQERRIYSHTGWRKVGDRWAYLMPGGVLGAQADVEMDAFYANYALPQRPESTVQAIQASFRFLETARYSITTPMLALAYLTPLTSILRPSFTLWLRADSGSFKSTLAALLMSHFGAFPDHSSPPMLWTGTANSLEKYLFDTKDCLAWIDDFNPQAGMGKESEYNTKADRILRALGNRAGRARLQNARTMGRNFIPRGMLLTTAEIYPAGESVLARLVPIDFMKSQVAGIDVLSAAQGEAFLYSHAMSAYIHWLMPQYDQLAKTLPKTFHDVRARIAAEQKGHARLPEAVAALEIGMVMFCDFAAHYNAVDRAVLEDFAERSREIFIDVGRQHATRIREEAPTEVAIDIVRAAVLQNQAVLFHKSELTQETKYGQVLIGWYDEDRVYLDPTTVHQLVAKWRRDANQAWHMNKPSLTSAFYEKGMLVEQDPNRMTKLMRINGHRERVMVFNRDMDPLEDIVALLESRKN